MSDTKTTHGNVRRLLILAKELESIEDLYFDLGGWGRYDENKLRKLLPKEDADKAEWGKSSDAGISENLKGCMTSGCAVGWAGTMPAFKKEGFKLELVGGTLVPVFEDVAAWGAVAAFFGLRWSEAEYLFEDSQYDDNATPKEVSARIRDFVRNGQGRLSE